ncbi:MAG: DUF1080 domain-containing protein [Pirellulales bacterium]|nr:DUF1080 domain-containing protein [Pirellulales bacterium]
MVVMLLLLASFFSLTATLAEKTETPAADDGWVSLFNGKDFDGWKKSERPKSIKIQNGVIVLNGKRAHLFYNGPVANHDFKNFELKVDVKTAPHSNSGVYFHTKFQPEGWPDYGMEVQVNQTHRDPIKTGSLYNVKNITEPPAKDNVWFNMHILVQDKHVIVKVDGKTVLDYTEPENVEPPKGRPHCHLGHGTFALQAHDPGSTVSFKNIQVKVLP